MTPEEIEDMWEHLLGHLEEPTMRHMVEDLQHSFNMTWRHYPEHAPGPPLAKLLQMLQEQLKGS